MVKIMLDVFTKMVKNLPMSELKKYLSDSGTKPSEFAKEIGVEVQSLYRYMNGERIPDREIMPRITKATSGLITANSFYQPNDAPTS